MSTVRHNNDFYRNSYNSIISVLIVEIVVLLILVSIVLYQIFNRPLPPFSAVSPKGQRMQLIASNQPNLLSSTLIRWASKAAVAAYTFDFANYPQQIALARPYFTDSGWQDYQASVSKVIATIAQNQLFVSSVVSGPPVISNQGDLSGHGYTWRIQIPFLVTYNSSEQTVQLTYTVVVTIVKIPTTQNPTGVGIDQFVMTT
jgi:intracellular multiplication protein IcmL